MPRSPSRTRGERPTGAALAGVAEVDRRGLSAGEAAERIAARARSLGFDVVGFARADAPLDADFERYEAFLDRGFHGEMHYLATNREARRRLDTDAVLAGARSVVCVGQRYAHGAGAREADEPVGSVAATIARYARGHDYHNHFRKRLRRLAVFVRTLPAGGVPTRARVLSDIEPVLERAWAARAGLGFIGKNGLVIAPGEGSYLLLGEVVTTLDLAPSTPVPERCGSCTRCLDACPTQAFDAPFVLDPRKCLSYLTIERSDPVAKPYRDAMGEHLFGCDVCQEVCPFNAAPVERPSVWPADRADPFAPLPAWGEVTLAGLVGADEERHAVITRGSPVRRPGRVALSANALIVAVNAARASGDPPGGDALREAEEAIEAGLRHPDARVREVASWGRRALARSEDGPQRPRV